MKKAPIAIALVLVFGLFAAAFSLGPAIAQYATSNSTTATSTNTSSTGNATSTNATTTGGSTFSARGSIASLIFDTGETTTTGNETGTAGNMTTSDNSTSISGNITMSQTMTGNASSNATTSTNATGTSNATTTAAEVEPPYILSGDWNLDVQNGNVSDFAATFTMVHTDGTGHHTHDLSNFQASNATAVQLDEAGLTFIFGTVDVAVNGTETWTDAGALIIIEKLNVVSISLATEDTDNHFEGQPIYGITDSFTDENGNELIQTQTAGNATGTGGNMTQGAQNAANETGEFIGNVTEGVQDFFNGTG